MMKKIFSALTLFSVIALASSCGGSKTPDNPNPTPGTKEKGQIALSLGANSDFIVVDSKAAANVDVNAFKVNIKDPKGVVLHAYAAYSEMEDAVALEEGDYTVEAFSAMPLPAEWEAPTYYGSTPVAVQAQTLKKVDVVCALSNIKVTVEFGEKFIQKVTNPTVTINNGEGKGILGWTPNETRAAYFSVPATSKRLTIVVNGLINGKPLSDRPDGGFVTYIDNVDKQQWHRVKVLDVVTNGTANPVVTVDMSLIEKDVEIGVPGSDDIIDNNGDTGSWGDEGTPDPNPNPDPDPDPDPEPTTPTIKGANFNGSAFDLKQPVSISVAATGTVLDVLFTSKAGIQNLFLQIISDDLTALFPDEMDLANGTAADDWYEMFADPSIGIIDPNSSIKGKKSHTFSVGSLMPLLGDVGGPGKTHTFKIRVVDANGSSTESLVVNMVE